MTGDEREAAIEKLFAELPNGLASGRLSPEQAVALEEWRQIRQRRSEPWEKLRALVNAHLASQTPPEAKAEIDAALAALAAPGKSRARASTEAAR